MLVNDSTARDEGTYVCRACNLYGSADAAKTIRVVSAVECSGRMTGVKPAIIVSRPADRLNVAVGEDIVVTLRVAGEPKPKGTVHSIPFLPRQRDRFVLGQGSSIGWLSVGACLREKGKKKRIFYFFKFAVAPNVGTT